MQTSAPLLHNMPSTQRSFPNVGIRAGKKDLVGGAGGGSEQPGRGGMGALVGRRFGLRPAGSWKGQVFGGQGGWWDGEGGLGM